jgi:hypothetical protein
MEDVLAAVGKAGDAPVIQVMVCATLAMYLAVRHDYVHVVPTIERTKSEPQNENSEYLVKQVLSSKVTEDGRRWFCGGGGVHDLAVQLICWSSFVFCDFWVIPAPWPEFCPTPEWADRPE